MSTNKTVLVSIGGIKRPVTFVEREGSEGKRVLFEGIKREFADILSKNPIVKPVFLVKNEDWRNEFVDIGENTIPDRAVVRIVDAVSLLQLRIIIMILHVHSVHHITSVNVEVATR